MEIEKIAALAKIMSKHGLIEIDLKEGEDSIFLKRGIRQNSDEDSSGSSTGTGASAEAPAAPVAVPQPEEPAPVQITAPMPGTFYSATSPENPPLVQVGDEVNENTVVCIVEAMKVMNEIKAETSGVISKILVENGSPIEYGQPLFEIKEK